MKKILIVILKNILIVISIIVSLFSINGIAMADMVQNDNNIQNDTQIILKTKYLYFDKYWNGHRILINITVNKLENLVYVEEYYRIDSDGEPELVNSGRYYDDLLVNNSVSFEIVRPKKGIGYSLIKGVVILGRERVFETWINSSATYKSYDMTKSPITFKFKKTKPEIEKRILSLESVNESINDIEPILVGRREKIVDNKYVAIAIIVIFLIYLYNIRKEKS